MAAPRDLTRLGDELDRLAGELEALDLRASSSRLSAERDRLSRTIRSYLVPRARDPEARLMVVFAGPTGSGKSTLINSLTGLEISLAGPLRPTTTGPIVLTDRSAPPGHDNIAGVECEVVVGGAPILESVVLVDTPDIDSTSTDHRGMAEALIDSADVVVFVTSALRYADAIPWQMLRRAESRGTDVIHVLNRVGSSTRGAVIDFRSRLDGAGLDDDLLTVPEHRMPAGAQTLPAVSVRSLRSRLARLAVDRAATAQRTFGRVLHTTLDQVSDLQAETQAIQAGRRALLDAGVGVLAARVDSLDLSGVAKNLIEAPVGQSRRAVRRWRRSRREVITSGEVDEIVDDFMSLITRDLRLWLAEGSHDGTWPTIDTAQVLSALGPVVRLALEGWVDFVRRIVEDEAGAGAGLAEAVLIASATGSVDGTTASILFGDSADDVVARAHRELLGRLRVVYDQVAAHVTEVADANSATIDITGLRAALASVVSRLTPVDA